MDIDFPTIVTVVGTLLGTAATAGVAALVAKGRARIDMGTTVTDRFDKLTNQLQEEQVYLRDAVRQLRADLGSAEEQIESDKQLIRRMRRHVDNLEDRMAKAGIEPPPRVGWE